MDLTTAWNPDTFTNVTNISLPDPLHQPGGICFSPDGLKLFLSVTGVYDNVLQYSLTTPWDIKTASLLYTSISLTPWENSISDIFIDPLGNYLYIIGYSSDKIHRMTMSTSWDISTLSTSGVQEISSGDPTPRGVFLSEDGHNIYIIRDGQNDIVQFKLGTAWDLTTIGSLVYELEVNIYDNSPQSFYWDSRGALFFFTGASGDTVEKFEIPKPVTFIPQVSIL